MGCVVGGRGARALCSGGWRMVPTPSIIWQPLALRLTWPLRPETECSISSEPSPPTSPLPLAQLLSEPRSGSGSCSGGNKPLGTQRNAQPWGALIIQGYKEATQIHWDRHLESRRGATKAVIWHTCELVTSPWILSNSVPPLPSLYTLSPTCCDSSRDKTEHAAQ